MKTIDFDLMITLEDLNNTLQGLSKAHEEGDQAKIVEQERAVCARSRTMYARYVDIASWSGATKDEKNAVKTTLETAVAKLRLDAGCIKAVNRRLEAFRVFQPIKVPLAKAA